jgi:hypothetical protein
MRCALNYLITGSYVLVFGFSVVSIGPRGGRTPAKIRKELRERGKELRAAQARGADQSIFYAMRLTR